MGSFQTQRNPNGDGKKVSAHPHLKFAEEPDDTGVIISYNTQSPKVQPGHNPVVGNNIGLVINPISWNRDTMALIIYSITSTSRKMLYQEGQ